jgi:hypothetical protein
MSAVDVDKVDAFEGIDKGTKGDEKRVLETKGVVEKASALCSCCGETQRQATTTSRRTVLVARQRERRRRRRRQQLSGE